jgi:hypothetical protein
LSFSHLYISPARLSNPARQVWDTQYIQKTEKSCQTVSETLYRQACSTVYKQQCSTVQEQVRTDTAVSLLRRCAASSTGRSHSPTRRPSATPSTRRTARRGRYSLCLATRTGLESWWDSNLRKEEGRCIQLAQVGDGRLRREEVGGGAEHL